MLYRLYSQTFLQNIFIDPNGANREVGEDLFPGRFIICTLEEPF